RNRTSRPACLPFPYPSPSKPKLTTKDEGRGENLTGSCNQAPRSHDGGPGRRTAEGGYMSRQMVVACEPCAAPQGPWIFGKCRAICRSSSPPTESCSST